MKRIAVYPGSFDPVTNGHIGVLERATNLFDEVIFLLAVNIEKKSRFSLDDRLLMMKDAAKDFPRVKVEAYSGLTVDYCRKCGAKHLIRGLRAVTDYEYEFQLAAANEFANPDVDMVFFMARKEETFISSSTVFELYQNGVDIAPLVPKKVLELFQSRYPLEK